MEGWIKIDKKLLKWEWADCPEMMSLWIHMLLLANDRDASYRGIEIKRGQFITSLSKLARATGLSVQQIRTALKRLQNTGEINIENTPKYSIVTISKFNTYQDVSNDEIKMWQHTANTVATQCQHATNTIKEKKQEKSFTPKENYVSKETIKENPQPDPLSEITDPDLKKKFIEWLEYRKKRKKPVNDPIKSYHLLMGPTRANGDTKLAIECLDYSMGNSWDGIFIEKNTKTNDSTRIHITSPGESQPDYGESTI